MKILHTLRIAIACSKKQQQIFILVYSPFFSFVLFSFWRNCNSLFRVDAAKNNYRCAPVAATAGLWTYDHFYFYRLTNCFFLVLLMFDSSLSLSSLSLGEWARLYLIVVVVVVVVGVFELKTVESRRDESSLLVAFNYYTVVNWEKKKTKKKERSMDVVKPSRSNSIEKKKIRTRNNFLTPLFSHLLLLHSQQTHTHRSPPFEMGRDTFYSVQRDKRERERKRKNTWQRPTTDEEDDDRVLPWPP